MSKLSCFSLIFISTIWLNMSESVASEFYLSQTFTMPDVTDRDFFGGSVALYGNKVLIGARGNDSDGNGVGRDLSL